MRWRLRTEHTELPPSVSHRIQTLNKEIIMNAERWSQIGRVAKAIATQLGLAVSLVAIDQTVRSFVNHKFKQYTTKKKDDAGIEVKPAPEAAPVPSSDPVSPEPVKTPETKPADEVVPPADPTNTTNQS
jgi:hypothetical protein